ncbi:AAA ATPase domain protein [Clostridium sporogenes]|uniref:P-loop NTPase fold protein n=1 Tax=Clostridium TaxID=1485 RepID=UPI00090AB931|nr:MULTISPECIES: P-loop NTPase fold protein [Clostridium]APF27227.1 AAA ATPase domain protein [Clostridium sporogenes]MDI6918017.1 P-loop NTPase fold protein [Clostridium botulinum]WMU96261.1 P-loop NTPase fold protein [Clostridium botulinum]
MFNTDKPINKISEDKLGRSSFAKQLANAIMQFKTKDNYAISLQGKWGCGKTSVLNMAVEEIRQLSEVVDNSEKIVIVQFNPWNFTDTNQLINQFFLTLSNSLKFNNKEQKMQNVGSAIEKYSSALEYSEYIPVVGPYLKVLPKLSAMLGKSMKDKAKLKQNDVSYRKNEVEQALRELDNRILVVIDDIDRLSNEQIQLIFQLVNAVAGFPNITYLLSFDKDIVVRALSNVQHCDGEEYLEKIIQVPFDVPTLSIKRLHNILFEKLDDLVEVHSGMEFDSARWSKVFNSCISPFINTLRDINRFCNTLAFMYSTVKEEVDFIDMAGICSLRVFASSIFEWIRENKFSLVGGYNGGGISVNDVRKQEEEMLRQFREIYPKNPQVMLKAVASLFPMFSNRISFSSTFQTPSEIHQAMRIASESKFDLYFSLSLDNIKISRNEIDDSLLHMKEDELRSYIDVLNERDLFDVYLKEIKYHLSMIPEERIDIILSVLVFQSGRIAEKEMQLIGADSTTISVYMISDLLFRISDENIRFNIIANMFSNSDFLSFQFLLHLLHIIELTYGRVAETSSAQEPKLISLDNLYKIEAIFLERTKSFVENTNLFDWKELRRVSFLWEFIEKETYSEYIKTAITNELNAIKFLALHVASWSSAREVCEYELQDYSYTKFISTAEFIKVIESVRITKDFWTLDEKIIESTVAFVLATELPNVKKQIEIKDVKKRIGEWKNELPELANS